jgi:hypothetical protein
MATVISTTFLLKRGTQARWEELDPILAQGEPGFAYDKNILKIGNGINKWTELEAINSTKYTVSPDGKSLAIDTNGNMTIYGFAEAKNNQIPMKGENGTITWVSLNSIAFDGIIKLRRDNDYNYETIKETFIPANGEICLVDTAKDGLRVKCGDGKTPFEQLGYEGELLIKGYYHNNQFYEDIEFTTVIQASTIKLYIDKTQSTLYYYDGENYMVLGGSDNPIPTATAITAGVVKLYDTTGINTDGTMTQKAITDELDDKVEVELNQAEELLIFTY